MTLSALALSLLSLVPRHEPEPRDDRIEALKKRVDTLEAERDRALEGVELVQAQLDRALERIAMLERYSARDRDAYYAMQAQLLAQHPLRQAPQGLQQQTYVNMLNQQNLSQQPQAAQQNAMLAQARIFAQTQNSIAPDWEGVCNCVPARHDMLRPRPTS